MAGKKTPRQIVKYMKKRPTLWAKSVANLRKSTKHAKNQRNADNKHLKFKQMVKNKKNKKKKENKSNNDFISKLKSIGIRQEMNGNNASELIIDSVLSAIITSKDKQNNNNHNDDGNDNDKD